jgi:hypothetical protein
MNSNNLQFFLQKRRERKENEPKQFGRKSQLRQCENMEFEIEFIDECDLEIMEILKQSPNDSYDDYQRDYERESRKRNSARLFEMDFE